MMYKTRQEDPRPTADPRGHDNDPRGCRHARPLQTILPTSVEARLPGREMFDEDVYSESCVCIPVSSESYPP